MKLIAPLPCSETHYLSSSELLARTKALVLEERRTTVALIEHLEEIQSRLLYAELGYSSLWEFATRELGLSEGAAQRRIQAMRLVRDVPEAKEKLESGLLSLSNAAKVQSFRQAEKKQGRKPDAMALITQIESLSQKECEKVLYQISPKSLPTERERIVSAEGAREITLVVNAELYEKLDRLKGLLAHSMAKATRATISVASYADLLEYMVDQSLRMIEKKKGITQAEPQTQQKDPPKDELQVTQQVRPVIVRKMREQDSNSTQISAAAAVESTGKRVSLPAAIKRNVWEKAQGQCQVVTYNRRCTSRYRLEIDHITPLALGGTNEASNLRLVCRSHNQLNLIGNLGCKT